MEDEETTLKRVLMLLEQEHRGEQAREELAEVGLRPANDV